MQTIRIAIFLAALTLLAASLAQANPIEDCNQSADLEKQIDGCTLFLEVDPFSPHVALAYGRRGEAYVHKGDFARAIADFDQAIRIDPRQARFLVSRGLAHREHGDLDSALADFSKAIEIDSRFADAFVNRCVAYEDKGKPDLAVNCIALSPDGRTLIEGRLDDSVRTWDVQTGKRLRANSSALDELDPVAVREAYVCKLMLHAPRCSISSTR